MYIVSDSVYKTQEIEIKEGERQIIFSNPFHPKVIDWLKRKNFPESFLEDIQSQEQSVIYEESEFFKLIILKYFKRSPEDPLLYEDFNIDMIITENKLLFLSHDPEILPKIVARFRKRYKPTDSLEYVTYLLLDIIVDYKMNIIDIIDNKLESIEDRIFAKDIEEEEIQKSLYFARRSLNRISKNSISEYDVVNKIYNHLSTKMRKKLKFEFIDLKEHLNFLITESKAYLERTGYLQNLLMGFLSNQMNQAMQRLAAISLIFLPLTFIVGNYGMNFDNMPELHWKYGYFAVWIVNIAIAYAIYRYLRKRKWI